MEDEKTQVSPEAEPPTEDQLRAEILAKIPQEPVPPEPEPLPVSNSGKASSAARKKLAERRGAKKPQRKPQAPKPSEPQTPAAGPEYQFELEGFGVVYAGFVQLLAKRWLNKKQFDADKKTKLIKIADEYAHARLSTIEFLSEFMPEIALFGATIEIVIETPLGSAHHIAPGDAGNGQDHTGKGADSEREPASDIRSRKS